MKRLQTLCLAVVTLALTACQKDVDSISIDKSSTFSPKVAREFFEERQNSLITRGASFVSEVDNLLVPYGYTPDWDKAEYFRNDHQETYEVPIITDRKLYANRLDYEGGYKFFTTNVVQKVLVTRNVSTGQLWSYIMTIIPDNECVDENLSNVFHHIGDDMHFSGLVYYSSLDGNLVRVSKYNFGTYKYGIYLNAPQWKEDAKRMALFVITAGTRIFKAESTRGGDDPIDGDSCPKCDNTEGCDYCTVYVTVEKCNNCGKTSNYCTCSELPPPTPDVPEEDPIVDPDPIIPEQGGAGSNIGGSPNYYGLTINNIQNIQSVNPNVANAATTILNILNGTMLPNLMNQHMQSIIPIGSYSDLANNPIVDECNELEPMKIHMAPNVLYDQVGSAVIVFADDITSMMTDFGIQVAFLHEMYHLYYMLVNGWINETSAYIELISHQDMLRENSPYIEWLQLVFPNLSLEEINKLKYAGVSSSSELVDEIPEDAQNYLDENVYKNK